MASALYTIGETEILNGTADLDNAAVTHKAMLVSSAYTFSSAETTISTAASARLGIDQTLASKTVSGGKFDAADVTWSAVTAGSTAAGVVIFRQVTNDTDSVPYAFIDITDTATNGGDITVSWDATNGIFYLA